jgi:hypothetical protein
LQGDDSSATLAAENMSSTKETWQKAKRVWENAGLLTLEEPVKEKMDGLGWNKGDLAKKLAAFDSATDLDKRRAAWAPASAQVTKYQTALAKAIGLTKDAKAKAGLQKLRTTLEGLVETGTSLTQDPKPSGRAEHLELVSVQNAAGGQRPKWLKGGTIDVKSFLVVDAEVMRLEKEGELGYHWTELQNACKEEVAKTMKPFADTIADLDEKIDQMARDARTPADQKQMEAKVKEANEALGHYAKIVERNTNQVVDKYWQKALARQAYLKSFKKECKVDIAMAAVAIAASSVSIAMSFGAAAVSAGVIAKATLEIGLTLDKYYRSADDTKQVLSGHMDDIEQLYNQRVAAKAKGEGQKASKAQQAGKEAVASAIGQVSASIITTTSRTLKESKEYVGKLSQAEAEAGRLSKKLDEFTSKFPSSPEGPDAASNEQMRKLHNNFKAMNLRYQEFSNGLREDIRWGENCLNICENLNKEDYVPSWIKAGGTAAKALTALGALAKLGVELASKLA